MSRLYWFQLENINKTVNNMMLIDFSSISEVRELRRKFITEVTASADFHVQIHSELEEFHDCAEYESRNNFGRKMVRILDEIIEELER